jgi:hypothetical protein
MIRVKSSHLSGMSRKWEGRRSIDHIHYYSQSWHSTPSVSFAHFTSTFMRIQGWMQH